MPNQDGDQQIYNFYPSEKSYHSDIQESLEERKQLIDSDDLFEDQWDYYN